MARKPEVSLGLGLGVATLVIGVHASRLPDAASQRVGEPGDVNLEAVRRQNSWIAAGIVSGVSLLAKDPTIFIMGGLTIVAIDWVTRINNWNDPVSGLHSVNPFKADMMDTAPPQGNDADTYGGGYEMVVA